LAKSATILDSMGSTELAANFSRIPQAEEKLRNDNVKGAQAAYNNHHDVGHQVQDQWCCRIIFVFYMMQSPTTQVMAIVSWARLGRT